MTHCKRKGIVLVLILVVLLVSGCQESDEAKYKNAQSLMSKGNYSEAIAKFESLGTYADSTKLTMYCRALQAGENGQYEVAIEALRALDDIQDSKMRIPYYQARAYEDAGLLDYALEAYKANPLFLDSQQRIETISTKLEEQKQAKYDQAIEYTNAGDYWNSNLILQELGDFKDSALIIKYNAVRKKEDSLSENDYVSIQNVITEYIELGEVLDAPQRSQALSDKMDSELSDKYQDALALVEKEDFASAATAFAAIKGYKDSNSYSIYCEARSYEVQAAGSDFKSLEKAKALYESISSFKDSQSRSAAIENVACVRLAKNIQPFTADLYLIQYKSKYGLIDRQGNIVTPIKWERIQEFKDGIAIVEQKDSYSSDSKYGGINEKGELVIPVVWDEVGWSGFNNSVMEIGKGDSYSNRKYGLIDNTGKIVVEPIYDSLILMDDGYAVVIVKENYHSKYGIIDIAGNVIVEPQWDDIETWFYSSDGGPDDNNLFHDGLAAVVKDKKTGFVDTTGNVVIAAEWDKAEQFSDGLCLVYSGGKYGYIDSAGTMVIKPEYTYAYNFHDGAAIVKIGTYKNKDEAYGLIDKSGKVIAQTKYEEIKYLFSSNGIGYFVAKEKIGSGWNVSWTRSVLDATGRLVGGQSWDYVSGSSKEGLQVKTSDGSYMHLNVDGTLSEIVRNNYYEEGTYVSYQDENELYGYKDTDENIVIPAQWAVVQRLFDGEFASVGAGNQYTTIRKYGAINRNGDIVVPCEYDDAVNFVDGQALVKKDGYWFVVDTEGNIVF